MGPSTQPQAISMPVDQAIPDRSLAVTCVQLGNPPSVIQYHCGFSLICRGTRQEFA